MPTVLLIDDSLSMLRPIAKGYPDTYRTWIDQFLDKFFLTVSVTNFLEHISVLVSPSSRDRHLAPFTRNYTELKEHLSPPTSATNSKMVASRQRPGRPVDFIIAFDAIQREFLKIWGPTVPATYIVITDGGSRLDLPRLTEQDEREAAKTSIKENFHGVVTVLVLGDKVCPELSWLADHTGGSILYSGTTPNNSSSEKERGGILESGQMDSLVRRLAQHALPPSYGRLHCGQLDSHVQLHPPVRGSSGQLDRDSRFNITVFGFLKLADVQSPPTDTRHLILAVKCDPDTGKCSAVLRDDDQQTPNLALLLHGALKVGRMVAVVAIDLDNNKTSPFSSTNGAGPNPSTNATTTPKQEQPFSAEEGANSGDHEGEDVKMAEVQTPSRQSSSSFGGQQSRLGVAAGCALTSPMTQDADRPYRYGVIYSLSDQRKANLALAMFNEGVSSLSWLGHFSHLAPISDFATALYNDATGKSPFPVRIPTRLSYWTSANDGGPASASVPANPMGPSYPHTSWINPSVLSADVQKVVRMSRRIVDRGPAFYKELNRVRAAALATGFPQVLVSLTQLLEREVSQATNAVAILELRHVMEELQAPPPSGSGSANTTPIKPANSAKIKAEVV